ncbi:uncharacterized protein BDW47DRAFT_107388 [Aspergillus candidus]|uniref:Tubby C-terminal-like domain-containing protein n=1 Tax=Aspergillus candidus TaxID=41067 RepID=A0A2I2F8Z6_ASPCN|nr:hypothetical protein BDW47DRAFT_107388 [Aspergillus candidus]PLB37100.1 hypothetical protein BDW47DRAFT_107388 [Aspergillus candidus]
MSVWGRSSDIHIGTSSRSSLSRAIFPRVRPSLRPPDRPIAIRRESITTSKTTLVLKTVGNAKSAVAYRITHDDDDGIIEFTVSGSEYGERRSCREFRDASGLPLFELHRRVSLRHMWAVTLPGGSRSTRGDDPAYLGSGSPRGVWGASAVGNFSFSLRNTAAEDAKTEDDKKVSLKIERYGNVLASFDVVDGDRKVIEVRQSVKHNQRIALRSSSKDGYRPALDIIVTSGVDLSVAAIIATIAADWVWGGS